ncbi:MAG: 7-carboxy-7-deazaguanine synthase QueE, partial [Acidimicrobiales bacterium]
FQRPVTLIPPRGPGETANMRSPSSRESIFVSEVFSAIQGEGALVGERQVFLRLSGCNIRCTYCDQPEALEKKPGPCRIEQTPGDRDWETVDSPLPCSDVVAAVDRLWRALPHHSLSVTGGEPLLQSARLAHLLPQLKERGCLTMLETNGILVSALQRVLPWVDHVSMDIKLDSVDEQAVDLSTHAEFLRIAMSRDVYVKIVIGLDTDSTELAAAVQMVNDASRDIEVFLQPLSPFGPVRSGPTPRQVLDLQAEALRIHPHVRVVPQTHKMIDQL